jgi:hypothetical protein
MNLYIKLSVCVPRLIPGRGFYAQISSEITSEFPGVTLECPHVNQNRLQLSQSTVQHAEGHQEASQPKEWPGDGTKGSAKPQGRPNRLCGLSPPPSTWTALIPSRLGTS